jgi:DNA repair exonuclease SbcCD ATPase subunit
MQQSTYRLNPAFLVISKINKMRTKINGMAEEGEEGIIVTEQMDKPLEESELGPTSIDVTDERISIGPTSIDVTDEQPSTVETLPEEHEEVQEQNKQVERAQEESNISKNKQKRRITSYLSNISKQVEKQGNQINKVTMMIQSIQKQKQANSTKGAGITQPLSQSIKQIQSQINQLQKQMARIQNDIQKIRTTSGPSPITRAKSKKLASSRANIKPRSKKSKSLKSTKARKGSKKGR